MWDYSVDGQGIVFCKVISKILDAFAETAMSILLIQIASGWTLTFKNIDVDDSIEIYFPMIALIVVVHIIIAILTFADEDASHKLHDYAGAQGFGLVILKMFIFAYFVWCYVSTRSKLQKRSERYY